MGEGCLTEVRVNKEVTLELIEALKAAVDEVESYKYDYPDTQVIESCNRVIEQAAAAIAKAVEDGSKG